MPDEPRAPGATRATNPPAADAAPAAGTDAAPAADAALEADGGESDADETRGETSEDAAADVTPDDVTRAARGRRGMLSDDLQYAVYLHPGALETLGETIAPFLTQGPHGPHLVCTDIDTAGALAEMTVDTITAEGAHQRTEVMFPVAMIRLVMSIGGLVDGFGFRTRV